MAVEIGQGAPAGRADGAGGSARAPGAARAARGSSRRGAPGCPPVIAPATGSLRDAEHRARHRGQRDPAGPPRRGRSACPARHAVELGRPPLGSSGPARRSSASWRNAGCTRWRRGRCWAPSAANTLSPIAAAASARRSCGATSRTPPRRRPARGGHHGGSFKQQRRAPDPQRHRRPRRGRAAVQQGQRACGERPGRGRSAGARPGCATASPGSEAIGSSNLASRGHGARVHSDPMGDEPQDPRRSSRRRKLRRRSTPRSRRVAWPRCRSSAASGTRCSRAGDRGRPLRRFAQGPGRAAWPG